METLVIQVGVNSRGQPQRDQRRIAGEVLRVGRALACELQLADPRVALDHALITLTPAGTSIAAVGGALKVNGQATTQAPLVVGDCIELGPYRLRVEAAPAGLSLALAVSLEEPSPPVCGEQIRADESRGPRQSRRRSLQCMAVDQCRACDCDRRAHEQIEWRANYPENHWQRARECDC